MLVLSRRIGEEIVIDGDIRVAIVAVEGQRVRLGITAPPYVPIDRKEIHDKRAESGCQADLEICASLS